MVAAMASLPTVGIAGPSRALLGSPALGASLHSPSSFPRNHSAGLLPLCVAQHQSDRSLSNDTAGMTSRVGGVLMPLLAAALVGGGQIMEAVMAPAPALAVGVVDVADPSGQDTYRDLLQKFKERREKALTPSAPGPEAPEEQQEQESPSSSALTRLKEKAEKARKEREANELKVTNEQKIARDQIEKERAAREKEAATRQSIAEKEKAVVEKTAAQKAEVAVPTKNVKQKSHGFLPLFVSQFFLLLATVGAGVALFVLPESSWKDVQQKVDDAVEKATPIVEDVIVKATPVATQAWQKAQEAGEQAKPYVVRAWEGAKPLAAKAVEASKPVLKDAQLKAANLLQQAQKNLNQ